MRLLCKTMYYFIGVIPLLFITLTSACSLTSSDTAVSLADLPTATITTPTLTVPSLEPIPMPERIVIPADGPFPEIGKEQYPTEALITWLIAAKTADVDPQVVAAELKNVGWISPDGSWNRGIEDDSYEWLVMDLTGDGKAEWIMTIYLYPATMTWGRPGDFLILGDEGILYRFLVPEDYFCVTQCEREYPYNFFQSAPVTIAYGDMTGDNQPELILYRNMGGAHTITQNYFVISYHFGAFENLVSVPSDRFEWGDSVSLNYRSYDERRETPTITMTYPDLPNFSDVNNDGLFDLSIHGGWHGSAGSGVQRTRTETWSWDGEKVALSQVSWDPTEYRMHLLWEANDLYYVGHYSESRSLFLRVIEEAHLKESPYGNAESHYHSERRFAAFRLILISLQEQNFNETIFWKDWLENNYPETPIAMAAALLLSEVENTGNVSLACDKVSNFLLQFETPPPVTGSLLLELGYANPSLGPEDVCRVFEN